MKDRVRGKAEELKGKLTGDKVLELKGQARQAVAKLRHTVRKGFRGESERHRQERGRQKLW
jgi:uncharacterized protein YjbJ (UPF0337 family)